MNKEDDIKIAGNLTISDWGNLEMLLKKEDDKNWGLAFHFFEERIKTRYFNPIYAILSMDLLSGEGFAVVNLQCSLIETIESFINGWKFSTDPYGWYKNKIVLGQNDKQITKNQRIFESFFNNRDPFKNYSQKISGETFYTDVRCGLLHEAQTKNNWKIKKGIENGEAYKLDGNFNIIYRENFQRDLEILIENYRRAIINGVGFDDISACELRENFIAKFNHICKIS